MPTVPEAFSELAAARAELYLYSSKKQKETRTAARNPAEIAATNEAIVLARERVKAARVGVVLARAEAPAPSPFAPLIPGDDL